MTIVLTPDEDSGYVAEIPEVAGCISQGDTEAEAVENIRDCLNVSLTIELDRETDGRWIADVLEIPGATVYGASRDEAIKAAQALALRALAEKVEHGEALTVNLSCDVFSNSP